MKHFALSLAVIVALCPVSGRAQDSGADAFANRDFVAARTLWQQEADGGAAEAMLGLGLLADRGFGQPRDLTAAFDWYMQAAELGVAEAQFNVAIMLDAGLGRPRQAAQAQVWYTRAALRDHARAQYNLGLLFETGDGIAPNPGLAAYWFDQAAQSVPAAAQKDLGAAAPTTVVASPDVLFGDVGTAGIELVWDTPPTANPNHLIEVVTTPAADANYAAPEISQNTTGSGFLDRADAAPQNAVWRVVNIADDDGDYAASTWSGDTDTPPPLGRITLLFDPEVAPMQAAASTFASTLRKAGYWVQLNADPRAELAANYVSYGYASDQGLARSVADFLPSATQITPTQQVLRAMQPGEIVVNLAAFR